MKTILITIIKIIIFLPAVYYFAKGLANFTFIEFMLGSILLSLPIILALIYRLTLYKDVRLVWYNDTWVKSVAGNRLVAWFYISLSVLVCVNIIVVRLYLFTIYEWLALGLLLPIFFLCKFLMSCSSKFIFRDEVNKYISSKRTIIFTVVVSSILFPLVVYLFTKDVTPIPNERLADIMAINFQMIEPLKDKNILAYIIGYYFTILDPYTYFSIFKILKFVYPILLFLGNGILFYLFVHFVLFLSLNTSELSLVFKPLGDINAKLLNMRLVILPILMLLMFVSMYLLENELEKRHDEIVKLEDKAINLAKSVDIIRFPKEILKEHVDEYKKGLKDKLNKFIGK